MGENMSSFLGPIHYWLYNKIQLQQGIVEDIFSFGKQSGLSLQEECDSKFGVSKTGPLEEMIDLGNIHGWLQEKVSQVEYKYAYSVTQLLKKDIGTLDELKSILFKSGNDKGQLFKDTDFSIASIYKEITDNLLDGMPCDHASSLVNQKESELVWKRNVCVHEQYWNEVGGDISIYYELRDAWLQGFVQQCGLELHKLDAVTYCIKKGEHHE